MNVEILNTCKEWGYKRGKKGEEKGKSAENLREKEERKERGRKDKEERKFCEHKSFIVKRKIVLIFDWETI